MEWMKNWPFRNLIFLKVIISPKIALMKDYVKKETISCCRNQYQIQICIPAWI